MIMRKSDRGLIFRLYMSLPGIGPGFYPPKIGELTIILQGLILKINFLIYYLIDNSYKHFYNVSSNLNKLYWPIL
ncbi:hypothetical protein C2G38_2097497 [Gigaspora rosea]|uniref:Uncharacterized protein n=1 Tax=Gigaspora rosea TaxID=44941 RepID=A0A397UW03_9GLOM|nr:hypothetical protein C2G38_2097497 [Gigaspora rosea]